MRIKFSPLKFALVLSVLWFSRVVLANESPNIILIMADDMGWGDPGYQGHPFAVTPELDRMASESLIFNRFYAAAPVCSPTRASVITGRHPFRYGVYIANEGHLPADEPNLAQLLKEQGYRTGHFGKWHLGTLTTRVFDGNRGRPGNDTDYAPPWERGFDVAFATESGVPIYNPLWKPRDFTKHTGHPRFWWDSEIAPDNIMPSGSRYWNEKGEAVTWNMEGPNPRIIMDRVVQFMDDSAEKGQPFFALVWFHTPHLSVVAGEDHRKPFAHLDDTYHQHYWGSIMAMDEQIGRLRKYLRDKGIEQETIITFNSDNGPAGNDEIHPGTTGGLRGRKHDLYEGGVRVPALIEWPGSISPGKTDFVSVTSDFLPTILDLLDQELESGHELDGVSLMPVIMEDRSLGREKLIGFQTRGQIAMIGQRYKVIDHSAGQTILRWARPPWNLELYDLVEDSSESQDLAEQKPEILEDMRASLQEWYLSVINDAMSR